MGKSEITEESRKLIDSVKEILLGRSDEEIHEMLVQCKMHIGDTIDRLLSQDPPEPFQEVKSRRDKKKETKDKLVKGGVDSSIQNPEFRKKSGGNKSNSDEATNVQGTRSLTTASPSNSNLTYGESKRLPMDSGEAASSSSATSPMLSDQPPSNSELTNDETKRVPISSGKAVSSSSVPISSGEAVSSSSVPISSGETKRLPWRFTFGSFGSERNASGQHSSLPSHSKLADDVPLKDLSLRDDQTVPAQENQHKSLSPFGNNLWLKHGLAPPEPSPQMENSERQRTVTMPKQYSLFGSKPSTFRIEALETASSLVPKKNQLAVNQHNSQPKVPSGLRLRLPQSNNNNTNRDLGLPQSGMLPSPVVTYTRARMSTEGSGSSGDNTEMLPSVQHQDGNSNMWPSSQYQRLNDAAREYRSILPGQQNQSPLFGQAYDQISYERRSTFNAFLDQHNARTRRDTSDDPNQTQQQQGPRNN